ncbi:MAG TPA: barstar family protein [Gallionella sp.]|nr:barstar family protein [Gallionella sp.]
MEITIDFSRIKDLSSFHSAFKETMGFPEFYGRNMDAWIDCMSCIDDPDAGMSAVTVKSDESLEIVLLSIETAIKSCPDVFQGFLKCVAFVNQRFIGSNSGTRLKLIAT